WPARIGIVKHVFLSVHRRRWRHSLRLRPILQRETGNMLKINRIACDQSAADSKRDRRNGEIIGADAELLGAQPIEECSRSLIKRQADPSPVEIKTTLQTRIRPGAHRTVRGTTTGR